MSGICGLNIANDAANLSAGLVVSAGNGRGIVLPTGMVKRIDAPWAAGSGNGGLDTGTVAAHASYHLFVIRDPVSEAVDLLFSGSPFNPVMPAGFTEKCRIGGLTTGAAGAIYQGRWHGGDFAYKTPFGLYVGLDISAQKLRAMRVPVGIKIKVRNYYNSYHPASTHGFLHVVDPDVSSNPTGAILRRNQGIPVGLDHECWTNSAGQIYLYDLTPGSLVDVSALGWYDPRDEYL